MTDAFADQLKSLSPVQMTALDWACQNTTREHEEQLPLHHTQRTMDDVRRDISEKAGPVVANFLGDVLEGGKVHLEDSVNRWKHRAGGGGRSGMRRG